MIGVINYGVADMILKKLGLFLGLRKANKNEAPSEDVRLGLTTREVSGEEYEAMLAQRRKAAKEWRSLSEVEHNAAQKSKLEKATKAGKERRQELGITHYVFRAAVPEMVDPRCLENDGKTFAFDSPPETGNPGDGKCDPVDGTCRCFASSIIPGFTR